MRPSKHGRRGAGKRRRALGAVAAASCSTRPLEQLVAVDALLPLSQTDRDAQRPAQAVGFDLDRAQAIECPPGDDLAARTVRAGKHQQQLGVAGAADAIEAAHLGAQRGRDVGERLLGQLGAVLARQLLQVADRDQQAA